MEFSCEQCGTRYSVPDEKVRGKRVRTKCRKCGAEIVVTGPGAPAEQASPAKQPAQPKAAPIPAAAPATTPQRAEERWTVAVSRTDQRKMTTAEIVEGCAAGTLTDQTLVWKHGMDGWKTPFDVPALSLALTARGLARSAGWREPGKSLPPPPLRAPSVPPPPMPAAPAAPSAPRSAQSDDALASDWDDENEATRVSEGALPFIARKLMADASAALASPASPKPAMPHAPPARRAPPARPALPARPAPVPAPTKPVAPVAAPGPIRPVAPVAIGPAKPTSAEALAPAMPTKHEEATGKADVAALMAHVTAARSPMPSAPDPSAFSFSDEATAVIAPDRARALLDAEAAKSQSEPGSETPMAFSFDEESTQVIAPDRAVALLRAEADKSPGETVPTERPPPAFPTAAGSTATPVATLGEKGKEPTIVVAGSKGEKPSEGATAAGPEAKKAALAGAPVEPKKAAREPGTRLEAKDIIHGFQNEPTRVVRVKSKSSQLWIVIALALVAAAAGGFIASEVLARHHAPTRPHAP